MADYKKISDKLIDLLSSHTESHYSTITNDMKGIIINIMDSAKLKEIDFTLGTGLACEGVLTYYGSTRISVVKMTWDGYKLMFYYYRLPDDTRPQILYNMTYDEIVSGDKKYVALQRMYDIIFQISHVLNCLVQTKEVTVTLSNGVKVICNVPEHLTQVNNLVDNIELQMKDFFELLNEAVANGQYTYDDINGGKEA